MRKHEAFKAAPEAHHCVRRGREEASRQLFIVTMRPGVRRLNASGAAIAYLVVGGAIARVAFKRSS